MRPWLPRRAARPGSKNVASTRREQCRRSLSQTVRARTRAQDARVRDVVDREIKDDYAYIRDHYATPRYPIVLAHGLLGFSELSLPALPTIHYWHGIREALAAQGASVITTRVPPSSSIRDRAARLADEIAAQHAGPVNIIAHSMGGLDARYMISKMMTARAADHPGMPRQTSQNIRVASLTTVSTPHRGSPFADYVLGREAGLMYLPRLYGVLDRAGLETGAFRELTTGHMTGTFNRDVVDDETVRYFSYGAALDEPPPLLSPFRVSGRVIARHEGPNDGLVSVQSSRWGVYQGTLLGVNHLDLINWPNRVRWMVRRWMGVERGFNAVAFYLGVADMLAREGL
ncbi:hypothetical protein E4U42_001666 [Claviceps africana]|uniref:DUF676 domain-containing protein n=1 Tax=Claviceps africana TaxID=83212 RepID=A0A8K0JAE7_9HYPO|nr:hypothetical protein E4U42_001666 [Claviceps africana]